MGAREGEAQGEEARRRPGVVSRQTEPGPKPGTYVLQIEIPDIDPDDEVAMAELEKFYTTVRVCGRALFPETWTTLHRVMPDRGKHGGPVNPDA